MPSPTPSFSISSTNCSRLGTVIGNGAFVSENLFNKSANIAQGICSSLKASYPDHNPGVSPSLFGIRKNVVASISLKWGLSRRSYNQALSTTEGIVLIIHHIYFAYWITWF